VDVSTEITEFVRQQILAQSATACSPGQRHARLALQLLGW
jgi:hypothetical protein